MSSTRARTLAAPVLVAALALTACGSGDETKPAWVDPSPRSSSPTHAATSEAPSEGAGTPAAGSALAAMVAAGEAEVESLRESMASTYSSIEVTGVGDDTLVYTYTYATQINGKAAAGELEDRRAELQQIATDTVIPALEGGGVVDPKVRYVYLNADGSEIWTVTLTK